MRCVFYMCKMLYKNLTLLLLNGITGTTILLFCCCFLCVKNHTLKWFEVLRVETPVLLGWTNVNLNLRVFRTEKKITVKRGVPCPHHHGCSVPQRFSATFSIILQIIYQNHSHISYALYTWIYWSWINKQTTLRV